MADQSVPHLDTFLTALRFEAEIPVGPHETVRLQHVFQQSPPLSRDQLHDLLACTLVKHPDQRSRFDALFNDWYDLAASAILPSEADEPLAPAEEPPRTSPSKPPVRPEPSPAPESTPVTEKPKDQPTPTCAEKKTKTTPWRIWALVGVMILSVVMAYSLWPPAPPAPKADLEPKRVSAAKSPVSAIAFPADPVDRYWTWVPEFEAPRVPMVNPATLALILAVLSLVQPGESKLPFHNG